MIHVNLNINVSLQHVFLMGESAQLGMVARGPRINSANLEVCAMGRVRVATVYVCRKLHAKVTVVKTNMLALKVAVGLVLLALATVAIHTERTRAVVNHVNLNINVSSTNSNNMPEKW